MCDGSRLSRLSRPVYRAIGLVSREMRDYPAQIHQCYGHRSSHRHFSRNEVVDGADAKWKLDPDVPSRALARIGELVGGFDSRADQPVDLQRNRCRGVEAPTLIHESEAEQRLRPAGDFAEPDQAGAHRCVRAPGEATNGVERVRRLPEVCRHPRTRKKDGRRDVVA